MVPAPAEFRENANWKASQPSDTITRGAWWEIFGSDELSALEAQIDVSNQTLKIAAARFEQARATVSNGVVPMRSVVAAFALLRQVHGERGEWAQVLDIAKVKFNDMNSSSLEMAARVICGTARSMGIEVID